MEFENRHSPEATFNSSSPTGCQDECCIKARAQAFEEAVSLALFTSAWMQHSRLDPQAARTAKLLARLLAASTGTPTGREAEPFAAARKFLGHEYA